MFDNSRLSQFNQTNNMDAAADCRDDRLLSEAAAAAVGGVMPENISPSQRCATLCCAVLYCTVLYCTVLYCTVLCCAVLCCLVC